MKKLKQFTKGFGNQGFNKIIAKQGEIVDWINSHDNKYTSICCTGKASKDQRCKSYNKETGECIHTCALLPPHPLDQTQEEVSEKELTSCLMRCGYDPSWKEISDHLLENFRITKIIK